MNTSLLKKFAQSARRYLREQVSNQLEQILSIDTAENRSNPAIKDLLREIEDSSKEQVIEKVAYLWFNRFCALRFMDANDYNSTLIVSPTDGMTLPELLQEAKQGNIDEELQLDVSHIVSLINDAKQDEAYRLLLVAACNHLSHQMPFMFEKISDYTELLLPKDLLSENSILNETREALSDDVCQDVEVIGWLYQFYISEKKDEVFADLKKNKKVTPENIPAATQLFTPNWIVRYLVENSLGRLWMLNKPNSRLVDQMEYYIKQEQQETDYLKVTSPEELKVCDPACGSGHMLVYAFELLYAIYEEEGYDAPEIPGLILTNNLFGLELDERAGELAAFALTMKAREKYRRFFRKAVQPNICVLEKVEIPTADMDDYMAEVGRDIFSTSLEDTIRQFKDADNFGSLIRPIETDVARVRKLLAERGVEGNMFLAQTHEQVQKVLRMVEFLSPRYQVVVANPPYMGGKGMNATLSEFAKGGFPASKSDLFAMFIERSLEMVSKFGCTGMVTMQSWMFLSSFEKLRQTLLQKTTIVSMTHLGARGFDSIGGEIVQTTAFIIQKGELKEYKGSYLRLVDGGNEAQKQSDFQKNKNGGILKFKAASKDFSNIPGAPIAYWIAEGVFDAFVNLKSLKDINKPYQGMSSSDNNRFLRVWYEIEGGNLKDDCRSFDESKSSLVKWFPYNKGGSFRKWYGNYEFVVNWFDNGREIRTFVEELNKTKPGGRLKNQELYFKKSITWSALSTSAFGVRVSPKGALFDVSGSSIFPNENNVELMASFLNSKIAQSILQVLNPTVNYQVIDIGRLPVNLKVNVPCESLVSLSKSDWDSFETSWDFQSLPLITAKGANTTLAETYTTLRSQWLESTQEMQRLEEENNRIFIDAYGLQEELTPEVPLKEITLTCNPHYRYGGDKTKEQLEGLILQDTIKEFISYAVGCMFGRYSLDKPGLILANAGETLEDYLKQVPQPTFEPDDDNVIPIMDVDWFGDDIAERFKTFLKITFVEDNYEENLRFVEDALGYKTTGKGKRQSIRDYFLKDFYTDHWKRYKKRPIYWMFSSPKGTFNALIYMHGYRSDTVSTVLNEYLREFSQKLTAHRDNKKQEVLTAEGKLKIDLEKEIITLGKQIEELADYERDLFELASKSCEELIIDLDDGVKVNYPKFGEVLKKIPGLSK